MKPIATINGIPVYSNKRMSGINNARIIFSDGSYADVSKMEVVNKGEGFITLKSPPGEDAMGKPITVTKTFKASKLSIIDAYANVDIQPGGTEIVVTMSGSKSDIDSVSIQQNGAEVILRGSGAGNGSNSAVMSHSSLSIGNISVGSFFRSGNVSIKMSGNEPETKITITVPVGTALHVSDVTGLTTIGDIGGSLTLSQSGQSKARVGAVATAQLQASGQSNIRIREVSKHLSANISGQSEIKVDNGKVDTLLITTSGQSEFRFNGQATDATLSADGQSEIDVAHVTNRPVRSKSGQADITVRNRD